LLDTRRAMARPRGGDLPLVWGTLSRGIRKTFERCTHLTISPARRAVWRSRGGLRPRFRAQSPSPQLAVLRSAPVDAAAWRGRAVALLLAIHAQLDAGDRLPPRLGDLFFALGALGPAFALGTARGLQPPQLVLDRGLDLFVNRAIAHPSSGHSRLLCEQHGPNHRLQANAGGLQRHYSMLRLIGVISPRPPSRGLPAASARSRVRSGARVFEMESTAPGHLNQSFMTLAVLPRIAPRSGSRLARLADHVVEWRGKRGSLDPKRIQRGTGAHGNSGRQRLQDTHSAPCGCWQRARASRPWRSITGTRIPRSSTGPVPGFFLPEHLVDSAEIPEVSAM